MKTIINQSNSQTCYNVTIEDPYFGSVWFVCLKTENYCLKIFVEMRVSEQVC